jgi:DtxR family Mn-dependent transcriptional regulator
MKLSEEAEEMLEKLWIELVEKKKKVVSNKTVDDDIQKELKKNKLMEKKETGIKLTAKGKEQAREVIRRHRLAERLFHDLLSLSKRNMESPACRFEHLLISGEVEEAVCTLLGHPTECPHGRRIPKGPCCKERRRTAGSVIHPLSELKRGQKGKVVYIRTEDHNMLKKLMAMGVLPGKTITLIQKRPSYVFSIGKTQVVVDTEIASNIHIRTER